MGLFLGDQNLVEVKTTDVMLSNPQRSGFSTQADANSYFAQKLSLVNSSWGQLVSFTWGQVAGKTDFK
jgi:hypothetical protein